MPPYVARTPADSMGRDVGFGPSTSTYHVDLYVAPWNRYQPYLVGAGLGYVLHHTRGQLMRIDRLVNLVAWQVMIHRHDLAWDVRQTALSY